MLDEMTMLAAAEAAGPPQVKMGALCVCISPTRGIQLARIQTLPGEPIARLVRVGGPANVIEESPDVLTDARIFMVLDIVVEILAKLGHSKETH